MKATLDKHQVLLLRRLYDACMLDASVCPDFEELMADHEGKLSASFYDDAYQDFMALSLLDPRASGQTMGPNSFGRLSSHGRWFVEALPAEGE